MKRTLIFAPLLIASCAHQEVPVEVREVPVISPVKCVDPAKIPPEPRRVANRLNGDAKHDLQIVAANARELRTWGEQMRTLLEQCTGKAPG